jgi:putative transposase
MQMKEKSKVSKMKQGKDFTMSSLTNVMQLELPLFAIAESQVQSKKTTLLDKLVSCVDSIPMQKLPKTSEVDSTSKEKDCNPYWSGLCEEISSRLLLPVETGIILEQF